MLYRVLLGFPGGLIGKESTCNVGDLSLISGFNTIIVLNTRKHTHTYKYTYNIYLSRNLQTFQEAKLALREIISFYVSTGKQSTTQAFFLSMFSLHLLLPHPSPRFSELVSTRLAWYCQKNLGMQHPWSLS